MYAVLTVVQINGPTHWFIWYDITVVEAVVVSLLAGGWVYLLEELQLCIVELLLRVISQIIAQVYVVPLYLLHTNTWTVGGWVVVVEWVWGGG